MELKEDEDARLGAALEYFADRLHLVFAVFFSLAEYRDHEGLKDDSLESYKAWSVRTIMNACLHTSLLSIRDLDDFFSEKKSKPDDMRAFEFNYNCSARFLTVEEREKINKRIAHSTWQGAAGVNEPWDMGDLVTKTVNHGLQFLTWVESHYGIKNFMVFTSALPIRIQTEKWLHFFMGNMEKPSIMKPGAGPAN